MRVTKQATDAIRVLIRQAIDARRRVKAYPSGDPMHARASAEFSAYLWSAKIVAGYAIP